jgi:small subunit ribosomal protein S16
VALKIRLSRYGDKKSPFYRMVVAESSAPRDGKFVDIIGTYDPLKAEGGTNIDAQKATDWLGKGATPTETAKSVLKKANVIK